MWRVGTFCCSLHRVNGVVELRIYEGEALRRAAVCSDKTTGFTLANSWYAERSRTTP